jgi:hypothetical protein
MNKFIFFYKGSIMLKMVCSFPFPLCAAASAGRVSTFISLPCAFAPNPSRKNRDVPKRAKQAAE